MAYTAPTYADFIARFPIFADRDQTQIDLLLEESKNNIDQSWREVDYAPAIMYLTAHKLALDNSQEGDAVEVGGASVISSESFGGMSLSYASGGVGDVVSKTQWGLTAYGRAYYSLLQKNKPPVVVA
jgi:hypothetical protein